MNVLVTSLATVCAERLLQEKWLVAPSLRVGHQWLQSMARAGHPAVNVRIETLRGLALELAGPELARRGATRLTAQTGQMLVEGLWHGLRNDGGYLWRLEPSAGLFATLFRAIEDLRNAGLSPAEIDPARFEVPAKGRELLRLATAYEAALAERGYVDNAHVLRLALDRLAAGLPTDADVVVLVPEDIDATALERRLLDALPDGRRITLPVDAPCELPDDAPASDLALLRWLPAPADAPPPAGDGTVRIEHAVGPPNEIRAALRRALREGVPLDRIELLYTDRDTYVPLLFELAESLRPDDGVKLGDPLPVTFAEGLPTRYARPGRALAGWLAWARNGFPQAALLRLMQDGLLRLGPDGGDELDTAAAANVLRTIRIGFGRDRTAERINDHLDTLHRRQADARRPDEDGEVDEQQAAHIERRIRSVLPLQELVNALLQLTPQPHAPPADVLAAGKRFLAMHAAGRSELDNFAREKLTEAVDEMLDLLKAETQATLDAWEWLAALPGALRIRGQNARPGHLHADHVLNGGHTGRPHTVIVGLDDGRFPGAGLQDPVILDAERNALSADLPTAARQLEKKMADVARCLARLRGDVTLTFASRDVIDDRETFAGQVVMNAHRIVTGRHEADAQDLAASLGPPAAFAPPAEADCLADTDWWLLRLCGGHGVANAHALLDAEYPHLARGRAAEAARCSVDFTAYDGYVPEAGPPHDFTDPASGIIASASRLELIGRCPLAFFFQRVLRIEPPEELEVDPDTWLPAMERGTLLHEVFRAFLAERIADGRLPDAERDADRLHALVEAQVAAFRKAWPVPAPSVFDRQVRWLHQAARIFLRIEEGYCRGAAPVYLEASLGMRAAPGEETPLDTPDPLEVRLAEGARIRTRGRIDRIDRRADGAYVIWDYKTGGTWRYANLGRDAFDQGRVVQHALYLAIVPPRLREVAGREAAVDSFGYFFPNPRGRGERIEFTPETLAGWDRVVLQLCRTVAAGAFCATTKADDCTFCDYRPICRDPRTVAAWSQAKLADPKNTALDAFRELRNDE